MLEGRIPIVVGVTGHRDIREVDALALRSQVGTSLRNLRIRYPHSPIVLLTSLAAGADQLVADCAAAIDGIDVVAVLPLELADYRSDFAGLSLKAFNNLLEKAKGVITSDALPGAASSREEHYQRAGCFIARTAQIMLALWDGLEQIGGEDDAKIGGTADIVSICRKGVRSSSLIAVAEPTLVYHVFTLRLQHSEEFVDANVASIGKLRATSEAQRAVEIRTRNTLASIERFNRAAASVTSYQSDASIRMLLTGGRDDLQTVSVSSELAIYAHADVLASMMQRQRLAGIRTIALMTAVAIVLQQIYSGPDMRLLWLVGYIGLAGLAFIAYCWFFRGNRRRDERYLDWRSLAEAMRVHIFWRIAGIDRSVADDYFLEDTDDLEWLRHAVRNVSFLAGSCARDGQPLAMKRAWLEEQTAYFSRAAPRNARKEALLRWAIRALLVLAGVTTLATLIFHMVDAPQTALNWLVLASGVCFVLAGTAKLFAEQMAFGELARRYAGMNLIFVAASSRFDERFTRGDLNGCKDILVAVGRQALAENVGWLRIHRHRAIDFTIG